MNNSSTYIITESPEYYFLKSSVSRYIGMYSRAELLTGFEKGEFQGHWLVTKKLAGEYWQPLHAAHLGPWATLGLLLGKTNPGQPSAIPFDHRAPNIPPPLPVLPFLPNHGWALTSGVERWVLTAAETIIQLNPGANGLLLRIVKEGEEVDYLGLEMVGDNHWYRVKLANAQQGYIPGTAEIRWIPHFRLDESKAEMRSSPDVYSTVVEPLRRGAIFLLLGKVQAGSTTWHRIRNQSGEEGFLDSKTKILTVDLNSESIRQPDLPQDTW